MRNRDTFSQLSQPLTEAPSLGVEARDGVVGQMEVKQRLEAIQRATVHLFQTVIVQMAAGAKRQSWVITA